MRTFKDIVSSIFAPKALGFQGEPGSGKTAKAMQEAKLVIQGAPGTGKTKAAQMAVQAAQAATALKLNSTPSVLWSMVAGSLFGLKSISNHDELNAFYSPSAKAPSSSASGVTFKPHEKPPVIDESAPLTPAETALVAELSRVCAVVGGDAERIAAIADAGRIVATYARDALMATDEAYTRAMDVVVNETGFDNKGFGQITLSMLQGGSRAPADATFNNALHGLSAKEPLMAVRTPDAFAEIAAKHDAKNPRALVRLVRALRNHGASGLSAVRNAIALASMAAMRVAAERNGAPADAMKAAGLILAEDVQANAAPRFIVSRDRLAALGESGLRTAYETFVASTLRDHVAPRLRERLANESALPIARATWNEWTALAGQPGIDCPAVQRAASALADIELARADQDVKADIISKLTDAVDALMMTRPPTDEAIATFNRDFATITATPRRGPFSTEQVKKLDAILAPLEPVVVQCVTSLLGINCTRIDTRYLDTRVTDVHSFVDTELEKLPDAATLYPFTCGDKVYFVHARDYGSKVNDRGRSAKCTTLNALLDSYCKLEAYARRSRATAELAALSTGAPRKSTEELAALPIGLAATVLRDSPNITAYAEMLAARGVSEAEVATIRTGLLGTQGMWSFEPATRPVWALAFEKLVRQVAAK